MSEREQGALLFPEMARDEAAPQKEQGEVEGTVDRVVYNEPNAPFTVARVQMRNGQIMTVVGQIEAPQLATDYRFVGEWVKHAEYGRQLRAFWYEEILPNTAKGIEKYLASGVIKGVGKAHARRIVKHLGTDALNLIESDPQRLAEVPRLPTELRARIVAAIEENRATRRVMTFLASHDVSPGLAQKIHRAFGDNCIEVIRKNPYRMADEIFGVSFKISDSVARRLGVPPDDPFRLRAGILHALKQAEDDGHMYLPRDELLSRSQTLLEADAAHLVEPLDSAQAAGRVTIEEDRVYLRHLFRLEERIVEGLTVRVDRSGEPQPTADQLAAIEQSLGGIKLAEQQRECLRKGLQHGIFIMTGGPGTGKTTTVRALLNWCAMRDLKVELAAPTGRASRRLAEASGGKARTLHRLLEYVPQDHAFMRDVERPLDCDVVIVDEASMIDAWLFAALLDAMPSDAYLVLVGDVDQLPSVGAGCVLRDLIASQRIPVVFLNEIFRQGEGSLIVRNSHRINRGEAIERGTADSDFFFMAEDDVARVADTVIELCAVRLPRYYGFDPILDVQVIAPMYRGDVGVHNLNAALQTRLNPRQDADEAEIPVSNGRARRGDKIMQLKNNYDKGVFNGDMGIITAIDTQRRRFDVRLLGPAADPVEYGFDEGGELVLAYACSVHKSQGSEFKSVVIPLTTQHFVMLQRNLLYTALTRARKLAVIVGSRRALQLATQNDRVEKRYTRLAEKLRLRKADG